MKQMWTPSKPFGLPEAPFDPRTGRRLPLGGHDPRISVFTVKKVVPKTDDTIGYIVTAEGPIIVSLTALNDKAEIEDIYEEDQYVAACKMDHKILVGDPIPAQWVAIEGSGATTYLALFDLVDVETDSFAILGTGQFAASAWMTRVKKTLAVSGCTWDDTDRWDVTEVAESKCVYILADRSAGTMTLTVGTSFPDGEDVFPLWYVPWIPPDGDTDGYIDADNVIDMRFAALLRAENDHSWHFDQASDTGGTVTLGKAYIAGVEKTVTSFPAGGTLEDVTTTTHYWVAIDVSAATATWGSGASVPANTATVKYWEVLTLTCAGSVITGVTERWQSDIRVEEVQDPGAEIDTLGASSEGSETAASDTWTANNESDHGLALWTVCRVVYNEAGDKKIYAFVRKATFDVHGVLYSVSGETRIEVDAAVAG